MIRQDRRIGCRDCEISRGFSGEVHSKPVAPPPGLHRKNADFQTTGTPTVLVIGRSPLSQRKLKREPSLASVSKFRIERKSLMKQ